MTALTDKIRAAIEERLQVARAASPGPWRSYLAGSEGARIYPDTGDKFVDVRSLGIMNGRDAQFDQANAAHVASNSPDVVDRSCEADLRVLERHGPGPSGAATICYLCDVLWPCEDAKDLAARYGLSDD